MSRNNNENNMVIMSDNDVCTIHLQECDELMEEYRKTENRQLRIEFSDLCYTVCCKGTSKTILSNVTGHFEPGKITAILGPSGAGKSTLLKIISRERLQNLKGTITINGIQRKKGAFRKEICYIPQQFALLPFLTTKETLYIAARLKLDAKENEQSTYRIVNLIAENLGLTHCLNTMASKLSGGERKRLSIGTEMVSKPSVFLLDEPTSGLDSMSSNQLINVLQGMARTDCTIVCAIHQPSSRIISHFDDIMVLAKGKSMYCGPRNKILDIFHEAGYTCPQFYNIAEFVIDVVTEQTVGDVDNLYQISRVEYEKIKSQREHLENKISSFKVENYLKNESADQFINNTKRLSMWQQQKILFLRSLIQIKRDNIMTKLRYALHVSIALLAAVFFYNFGDDAEKVPSCLSSLFISIIFLFFTNSLLAVLVFPAEMEVLIQEHLNNWYYLRSYYIVKILSDFPVQILSSSSFIIIFYYTLGYPMEYNRFLQMWIICILVTILAQVVGVLASGLFGLEIGSFSVVGTNIPLLLFSGFLVKLDEIPTYLQYFGFLSHFKYSFEGLVQAAYLDRSPLSCPTVYCYLSSSRKILSMMNLPTMPFYGIVIILVSWILCLHALTYTVLYWRFYYAKK